MFVEVLNTCVLKGLVDRNLIIHLLGLTRNSCEICNYRSLAGIEPAALRFRQALKYLLHGRLTKCPVTLSLGRTYVR
jgi:hypothetical protein